MTPSEPKGIEMLLGLTLAKIEVESQYSEHVLFITEEGRRFKMWHYQECCESVALEEVVGEFADLIGSPITMAEEASNEGEDLDGIQCWTFYKLATVKGYVTLRWLGYSNGYYGVGVDFQEISEVQP